MIRDSFIKNLYTFHNGDLNDMFTYFRVNNINDLASIIINNYTGIAKIDYAYMPPSPAAREREARWQEGGRLGCNDLIYYSKMGYTQLVDLLIRDKGIDPSCNGNLAIEKAEENGHLETVKLLLDDDRVKDIVLYEKYPKNAYDMAMLTEPKEEHDLINHAESGDGPAVYHLIQAGADPSYLDNLAIVKAEENNHMEIVEYLLGDNRVSSLVLEYQYPERAYHMLLDNDDDFESDSDMQISPVLEDDVSTDIEMDVESVSNDYEENSDSDTDIES